MAGLLDAKTIIGVCRIRITPRQADCTFLVGAKGYVLDAPLELSWTVNRVEGTEISNKKLNGIDCAPIKTPGYDKSLALAGKFCDFCTVAFASIFNWTAYVDGADTYAVGRPLSSGQSANLCTNAATSKFALEVFTPVRQTNGICDDSTVANIRVILPLITETRIGDTTFAAEDTTNFSLAADGYGDNGTYLNGPYNDFHGGTGMVVSGDGEIWEALPSGFTLPTVSCTGVAIPSQA